MRGFVICCTWLWGIAYSVKLPPPDPSINTGSFDLIVQANLELKPNVNQSRPPLPGNVFEADLVLTKEQRRNIDIYGSVSRAASGDTKIRWPNGVIPYEIDCSLQRMPNAIDAIKKAMQEWESKTCIRFVQRNGQKDYLWFFRNKGCWSNVGRIGNKNSLSVGDGCEFQHVMVHEIGHAIGFWHEQSRPDRDSYVRVNKANIIPGFESAFEKYARGKIDSLNIPYDYESIMHYPFSAFSKNGKPTLTALRPLNGKTPYRKLSSLDALQANKMYNNCGRKLVPEPYKRKKRDVVKRARRAVCRDYNVYCSTYARQGQCRYNPRYMRSMCKRSCGLCPVRPTPCRDRNLSCRRWARQGECWRNPRYMHVYCKLSCRKCTVRPRPPTPRPRPPTPRPRPPTPRPKPTTKRPKPPTQRPKPPIKPGQCGVRHYGRFPGTIVDGQTAVKNSWPWQVQILTRYGTHHCGGSLLNAHWVLTAAHCVGGSNKDKGYRIKLGEHHIHRNDRTEQQFSVSQIIVHPRYDRLQYNNDIALLKLSRPASLNKAVNTICLPSHGVSIPPGKSCYITGWGRTGSLKPGSVVLQEAMMPSVSQKKCAKAMGKYGTITTSMLCAGYGGSSTVSGCRGDSGGPLVCKGTNNKWVLQGTVSWGTRTCSAGYNQYTVFARISEFVNWIRLYIGSGVPQTPPPPVTPPTAGPEVTPPPPVTPPTDTSAPTTRKSTPSSRTTPLTSSPKPCVSPKPLGMQDKRIPDSAISSSTQVNRWHSAREARLHHKPGVTGVGAWCSRDLDNREYLEIDLGAKVTVTGVATQGRESKTPKFVKSYAVLYSDDGNSWTQHPTVFTGNIDMSTVTTNSISPPISAQYIRINPQTWKNHICMRTELYGCQVFPTTSRPTSTNIPTSTRQPKTSTTRTITPTHKHKSTTNSQTTQQSTQPPLPSTPPTPPTQLPTSRRTVRQTTTDTQRTTHTNTPKPTTNPETTQRPTQPPLPSTPPLPTTLPPTVNPGIKTIPPNPIGIKCKDSHGNCATWAKEGRCSTDGYVKRNCLKSCNSTYCDNEPVRAFAPCSNRLGLGWDNRLPDSAFTASSELNIGSWDYGARNARMYIEDDHTQKRVGAWCAASSKDQWLQVDLGTKTYITSVATQGRHKYFEHVKTFKLSHSIDGGNWTYVTDDAGSEKVFTGNCDHFTPVINKLRGAVQARYVRFHPVEANYVCMRVEIYGCT